MLAIVPIMLGLGDGHSLVVFVGLQASGKTTFYRRHLATTHAHVSKDNWPNAKRKERRQARVVKELLGAGRSVVVDNTNPGPDDRRPLVELAWAHDATVIAVYFDSTMDQSLTRNELRQGRARVPLVAIRSAARRLRPPTLQEGFDRRYLVRITRPDEFDVTEWSNDDQRRSV
jgi:predicted kinase